MKKKKERNYEQRDEIRRVTADGLRQGLKKREILSLLNDLEIKASLSNVTAAAQWIAKHPDAFDYPAEEEIEESAAEETAEDYTKKLVKFITGRDYLDAEQKIKLLDDFCNLDG